MPRDPLPVGPRRCLWLHARGFWRFRVRRWSRWFWPVAIALATLLGIACVALGEEKSLRPLLDAIATVESGADDSAVGDNGRSRGPLQCGRAAWKEGCEFLGVTWDYGTDVWKRFESEAVFIAYTHRWGARTFEERARTWVGGPRGRFKPCTLVYWKKVRTMMKGEPDEKTG